MRKKKRLEHLPVAQPETELPPGVTLKHILRGHTGPIGRVAWSPDGRMLASPSQDATIRLWNAETGECVRELKREGAGFQCVAFDRTGNTLASMSYDGTVGLWNVVNGTMAIDPNVRGYSNSIGGEDPRPDRKDNLSRRGRVSARKQDFRQFYEEGLPVNTLFYSAENWLVIGGSPVTVWDVVRGKLLRKFGRNTRCIATNSTGDFFGGVTEDGALEIWARDGDKTFALKMGSGFFSDVAFHPTGRLLATGWGSLESPGAGIWRFGSDGDLHLDHQLEGHTSIVDMVEFSSDGLLLASRGNDDTIRLWRCDTWASLAVVPELKNNRHPPHGLVFHPHLPILATVGSAPGTPMEMRDREIHIFSLDIPVLYRQPSQPTVTYTSAKVVLVGDSGVGKTGLGWRLAHGDFKEHSSTHGQQFWLLNQLCKQRRDGAQCEAVLWDLAGQEDYRLIHALFIDDADLALVLFDPSRPDDPLSGVEFWLKQLMAGKHRTSTPTILIAARSDRGTPRLTLEELTEYCKHRGIAAYLATSAKAGEGIDQLISEMQNLIPWDDKAATVTTETFKRIKDFVLDLKVSGRRRKVILTPEELRKRLMKSDRKWTFADDEMLTAVGHLANHGYVTKLKTSNGSIRILLVPELLNNLAASFVLEARRNRRGLGSLEEKRLLSGGYKFPELEKLTSLERDILVDSAAVLFLEHNVCFRETDPLRGEAYLVFPELSNLKRPSEDDTRPMEDGVAYTVSGAVENVYASLVVLMGYTQTFTRTNQWRNHARYEVGAGQVCGFRLEEERAGELDLVLFFGDDSSAPVRMLFQSLFENFLARRNLTVRRFEPVACSKGHPLNRGVVREQLFSGADSAFCSRCGEKIILPKSDQPIQLTRRQEKELEANRRAADNRSRFEQVLFRIKSYVMEAKLPEPACFISYAWGNAEHERWVEKLLATDLQKAGITVVLDRWDNARIGASVPRFVERVAKSDRVIVIGTKLYQTKYENNEPMRSFVVAAEGDLIGKRMIGTEAQKESVLPVLLEGTAETAFPQLLQGRVYADFRKSELYFGVTLELLFSLYGIQHEDPVATELRETLKGWHG